MAIVGRVTILQGDPARVDAGLDYLRDKVQPAVSKLPGSYGVGAWVNRETGLSVVITVWADEATMRASDDTAGALRAEAGRIVGAHSVRVELMEANYVHQNEPDQPGYWARTVEVALPADRLEEVLTDFREQRAAQLLRLPGVTSVAQLVNRRAARAFVTVTFPTRSAMDATREEAERMRQIAMAEIGAHVVQVYENEVAIVGIDAPTGVPSPRSVQLPTETTV